MKSSFNADLTMRKGIRVLRSYSLNTERLHLAEIGLPRMIGKGVVLDFTMVETSGSMCQVQSPRRQETHLKRDTRLERDRSLYGRDVVGLGPGCLVGRLLRRSAAEMGRALSSLSRWPRSFSLRLDLWDSTFQRAASALSMNADWCDAGHAALVGDRHMSKARLCVRGGP